MTIELTDIIRETLLDREVSFQQGHNFSTEKALRASVETVRWEDVPDDGGMTWPLSPALAVQAIIKEFDLRGIRRVGLGQVLGSAYPDMEPSDLHMYQIIAIEQAAANGDTRRVWFVDRGTDTVPAMVEAIKTKAEAEVDA